MRRPNVLFLAIDGLRPDFLGVYGNSVCATPAFDALATESAVFDFAYCQTLDPDTFYNNFWGEENSIIRAARESGYRTALLSDDPRVSEPSRASHFSDVIVLPDHNPAELAAKACDCRAVQLLARAAAWVRQGDSATANDEHSESWLAWIHCGALTNVWDAPLGPFFDAEDIDFPDLTSLAAVPDAREIDVEEADVEIFRERYADQVEALDCGLQLLLESLAECEQFQNTLVLLAGLRGFPLGEHGRFGFTGASLFEELVHVPLLIRTPDGDGRMTRSLRLASTADILPTVFDACQLGERALPPNAGKSLLPLLRGEQLAWRDSLLFGDPNGERAVRTPDWFLRMPVAGTEARNPNDEHLIAELYSKPDDRWDTNEIGSRCEDVVAELVERLGSGSAE